MIVPPTQMLIVASQHAPRVSHSEASSSETELDLGAVLLIDTAPVHTPAALRGRGCA